MAAAILYQNQLGSLTPSTTPAALDAAPASNLADPQPRLRAAFTGTTVALVYDLGAAVVVDAVAIISTPLSPAATTRVRLSVADATGAAGDAWDSGTVAADTNDAAGGNVVLLRPDDLPLPGGATLDLDFIAPAYFGPALAGRYLRIDVTDGAAARIDLGRVVAGPLWRIAAGAALGSREGRIILDSRDRNALTGAEFALPAIANPRVVDLSLPLLTQTEATGPARAMLDALGAAGDALWVPETSLSRAELNRRCVWGSTARGGEDAAITQQYQTRSSGALRFVERL